MRGGRARCRRQTWPERPVSDGVGGEEGRWVLVVLVLAQEANMGEGDACLKEGRRAERVGE